MEPLTCVSVARGALGELAAIGATGPAPLVPAVHAGKEETVQSGPSADGTEELLLQVEDMSDIRRVAAIAVESIGHDADEAFAMVDLGKLCSQYGIWQERFEGRVKPFYAVKCNPDPQIIRTLGLLGANFDCASQSEIETVLGLGFPAQRILFANPCKFRSDLKYARSKGVTRMTFDSMNELDKIKETFPEADLLLRLRVEDEESRCPMSMKFGAFPHKWDELMARSDQLDLHLKGVSFHVGSGCTQRGSFTKALSDAKDIFDLASSKYAGTHGKTMAVLDIGGGFPGDAAHPCFAGMVDEIMTLLKLNFEGLEVIAEPGRFFVHQCTTLVTKIFGVTADDKGLEERSSHQRQAVRLGPGDCDGTASSAENAKAGPPEVTPVESDSVDGTRGADAPSAGAHQSQLCETEYRYFLCDGVYGSFNNLIYDHAVAEHPVPLFAGDLSRGGPDEGQPDRSFRQQTGVRTHRSWLFGPTCDGFDRIGAFQLPTMHEGDRLIWRDMGAYTQAAASRFNGIRLPVKFYYRGRESGPVAAAAVAAEGGGAAAAPALAAPAEPCPLAEPLGAAREAVAAAVKTAPVGDKVKKRRRTRRPPGIAEGTAVLPEGQCGEGGRRFAAGEALRALGDLVEPVVLLDLGVIRRRLGSWRAQLRRVRPYFAVRRNPDKKLLRLLHEGGCSFVCASAAELSLVLSLGAEQEDIIFSEPCHLRSHISFARQRGVRHMTFDSAAELRKIAVEHPCAKLLLRISVAGDGAGGASPRVQSPRLSELAPTMAATTSVVSFGAAHESWALLLGLAAGLGLQVVGVSLCMEGFGHAAADAAALAVSLEAAREACGLLRQQGFVAELLDIGGAFSVDDKPSTAYAASAASAGFAEAAAAFEEQLAECFPAEAFSSLRIVSEGGQFLAGGASSLLTKVIQKETAEGGTVPRYVLNDGVYGSFSAALCRHVPAAPEALCVAARAAGGSAEDSPAASCRKCCLLGPTRLPLDVVLQEVELPELEVGDWLLWQSADAPVGAAGRTTLSTWHYAESDSLQ